MTYPPTNPIDIVGMDRHPGEEMYGITTIPMRNPRMRAVYLREVRA